MKKVTMEQIARQSGVSQTAVSLILNNKENARISEETRQKVLNAAKELNYTRLGDMKRHTSKLIGLMVQSLTIPYFIYVLSCVSKFAYERGYGIVFFNTERQIDREVEFLNSMLKQNVRGMIITYTPSDPEYFAKADKIVPIVLLGESDSTYNMQTIGTNSFKAGEMMATYLYELGHRSVAFVSLPIHTISLTRKRRIEGAQKYYETMGAGDTFYILDTDTEEDNFDDNHELNLGRNLCNQIMDQHDVTAFIGSGDLVAIGICQALKQRGLRIPTDVSVMGIDNTFVCNTCNPTLTSLDLHLNSRSKIAVDELINRIEYPQNSKYFSHLVDYSPSIVTRGSTALVRQKMNS